MKRMLWPVLIWAVASCTAAAEEAPRAAQAGPANFKCVIELKEVQNGKQKNKTISVLYQYDKKYRLDEMDGYGNVYSISIADEGEGALRNIIFYDKGKYNTSFIKSTGRAVRQQIFRTLENKKIGLFMDKKGYIFTDTGGRETIAGYECAIVETEIKPGMKAGSPRKITLWQAPDLGDMPLKCEISQGETTKYVSVVTGLDPNFADEKAFDIYAVLEKYAAKSRKA